MRETVDLVIYIVITVGFILAGRRLYQDLTRPLPDESRRAEEKKSQSNDVPNSNHKKGR